MSYASKKSIAKAQGVGYSKDSKVNTIRHRGMQRDHVQVTPDGKVIQHYRMDPRSARFMKLFKEAQAKKAEEVKAEEVKAEEVKAEEVKAEEVKAEE